MKKIIINKITVTPIFNVEILIFSLVNNTSFTHFLFLWLSQEVWTLCRIMKRNAAHKKHSTTWRKLSAKYDSADRTSKACNVESTKPVSYFNCSAPVIQYQNHENPTVYHANELSHMHLGNEWEHSHVDHHQLSSQHPSMGSSSSFTNSDGNELFTNANWDELRSVVRFAFSPPPP